jgi:type VI protein secretion system component Hcp
MRSPTLNSKATGGTKADSGKVTVHEIAVVKRVDASSP